jgi:hypothetical protein
MARDILPFVAETPVAHRHENEAPYVLRLLIHAVPLAGNEDAAGGAKRPRLYVETVNDPAAVVVLKKFESRFPLGNSWYSISFPFKVSTR